MPNIAELASQFDLFSFRSDGNWIYSWKGISTRDDPISAEQYLKFAEYDLADGGSARNFVNALTNAKRALHLRREDVCIGLGFESYSGARSFPRMVEYLSRLGVTAPRILNRLNQLRNQVEHDYLIPTRTDVETFIDVTSLFVASTQRWINPLPCDIEIHQEVVIGGQTIVLREMSVSWRRGLVLLHFTYPKGDASKGTLECQCLSQAFFYCARLALENDC